MKLGSLFDGIGGFPLVASWHGITPVWASEIVPACVSITKRQFSNMAHLGDITKINGAAIEPVDIITFGSPCQDLSVAGKRAGLAGERSGLFGEAIRIIDEMREATDGKYPTIAVWENVPGALSSNNGLDFRAVLQAFTETEVPMPSFGRWATAGMVRGGHCDIAWRIVDAQHWGVPQRRRRVFVVADFGGQRAGEILFKPSRLRGYFAQGGATGQKTAGGVGGSTEKQNPVLVLNDQGGSVMDVSVDVVATLRANAHGNNSCVLGELYENHPGDSRITGPVEVCPTVTQRWGSGGGNTPLVCAGFNGWRSESGSIEYSEDKTPCMQATMPPNVICAGGAHANAAVDVDICPTLTTANDLPYIVRAYSFDSLASNSMKSSNPKSGCREVTVAKTLDTSPPNPAKNQGGIAIVAGFCHKASAGAGTVGYQKDVAPTLKAGQECAVFACRTDQTGSNGLGVSEGIGYTLDGSNGQAVVSLDCRNLTETEELSGTLQAKNNGGYSLNYINPVLQKQIIRRLTPTECERLQGFYDGWTAIGHDNKPISDAARYRALGNSVALPCVDYVLGGIAEVLTCPTQ